jgi:hypothetical protein
MQICVDHKGPLESCDIDPLYIHPICVPMSCGMKNGENVSGRGRRSHPGCIYSSSVGKLDQAGSPVSACTGLYRQKGKINPGDTGSQPKQLHIRADI